MNARPLCPRSETVIMSELAFVYLDNGQRTLRLGRSAYAALRERMLRGECEAADRDMFQTAQDITEAVLRFEEAERWPPLLGEGER